MGRKIMKMRLLATLCALLASGGVALADGSRGSSIVVKPKAAERFVTLPEGVRFPEGIAANPANGDIYAATFDFGDCVNVLVNEIVRYSRKGKLLGTRANLPPLLGLEYNPLDNKLYFTNFGQSLVQRVAADLTGAIETVASIPRIGAPPDRLEGNPDSSQDRIVFEAVPTPGATAPNRAPNAMTFNGAGDLFISDSFQGIVFVVRVAHTKTGDTATVFVRDGRLATAGFPPFGANGLAFNADGSALFIANTGDDRIFKLAISGLGAPGEMTAFAQSVNGADGLAFDNRTGLLWVAANQADEIVALNAQGRPVARLGAFLGFDKKGAKVAPRGLLFPASLVRVGDNMYVTNAALALTSGPGGAEPEADVNSYTISRIDISGRDDDRDD
jgi:DNA-binding beta-propeller fold protein YncE